MVVATTIATLAPIDDVGEGIGSISIGFGSVAGFAQQIQVQSVKEYDEV